MPAKVVWTLRARNDLKAIRARISRDAPTKRRRLAAKGMALGRKLLSEVATVFTPDTIPRKHRQLVAQKWGKTGGKPVLRSLEQTVE